MLACAVRLLDRGFFRIGTEEYTAANESYGLATMRKEHVTLEDGGAMVFDYPAKSGKRQRPGASSTRWRSRSSRGSSAAAAAATELLAYKDGRRWRDVALRRHQRVHQGAHRRATTPPRTSAPGTRRCSPPSRSPCRARWRAPRRGRKRAITRAVKEVAHYLGNTPAVCRASYIDPRVFDAYQGGLIIRPALEEAAEAGRGELPIHQPAVERAVLDLIDERDSAPGVEKVAA